MAGGSASDESSSVITLVSLSWLGSWSWWLEPALVVLILVLVAIAVARGSIPSHQRRRETRGHLYVFETPPVRSEPRWYRAHLCVFEVPLARNEPGWDRDHHHQLGRANNSNGVNHHPSLPAAPASASSRSSAWTNPPHPSHLRERNRDKTRLPMQRNEISGCDSEARAK